MKVESFELARDYMCSLQLLPILPNPDPRSSYVDTSRIHMDPYKPL